jgi:hypothetical protein
MIYNTEFSIHLRPHGTVSPEIRCGVDDVDSNTLVLTKDVILKFDQDLSVGQHRFILEFANKTNDTPDMAVEVVAVSIEGMTTDRFKWAGVYYPDYPEPWASEQTEPLLESHKSATYLGWNGQWELEFSVPIFTWIHKLENLGWIYA